MKTLMYSSSLLLFFLLIPSAATRESFKAVSLEAEGTALAALKDSFDHPLLNSQWIGPQCSFNQSRWIGIRCLNNHVISIALEDIGLSRPINDPLALFAFTELAYLSFKNNSISGLMLDFSANRQLSFIDLSINDFTGPISTSLLDLPLLQSLVLHSNGLTGSIPPLIQISMNALNFSYNNLTGEIPNTTTLQFFNYTSFLGNPGLCGPPTLFPCQTFSTLENENKKKQNIFMKAPYIAIFAFLDIIVLVVMIWTIFAFCRRRSQTVKGESREKEKSSTTPEVAREYRKMITFFDGGDQLDLEQLLMASAEGLGKGGFGSCYKAKINEAREIVVKRLRDLSPLTSEEFAKHMKVIEGLKHPNLLGLMGYYYASDDKLFFYKFVSQGNLYNRIHGGRGGVRIPFRWSARLSIAKGVARAIEYLHRNYKGPANAVPHGNLKSSNVLIDDNDHEVALVCDYGLIPLLPAPLATQRMLAYRSPEYQDNRTVSRKSDVWSYGCLLLELVTGRISEHTARDGVDLFNWVHRAVREEWTVEVFDGEISGERGAMRDMFKLLQVALRCCERFPERRPEMVEVTKEVEAIKVSVTEDDDDSHESATPHHSSEKDASGSFVVTVICVGCNPSG